ncbi:YdeI/OmpD-associated family protein [Flavobacterium sp.]|uniref:YdeI/OmpD-associated family protein n=1 Tax=Flavobacterium sp. TaxID=239 RepID=UPI002BB4503F|nr:YdeI/OmpD-associated family protein [Flavobacterium sp.]HSD05613.1 YdeI/OmpD-associated family protein [Flavobacterium sp.]
MKYTEYSFSAEIKIIGVNPYVTVPESILESIFKNANKNKGPIPIKGTVNDKPYIQTLMKYAGSWRLYINTMMLKNSPKRIGETIEITISFDPKDRKIEMHPLLKEALNQNETAKSVFEKLAPSRQKEIIRYISHLKTEEKIKDNVLKAINFLLGNGRFAGREKP